MRHLVLLALVLANGCAFDPSTPADAVVLCSTADECQPEQACSAAGRCVDVDALDTDPPKLLESTTAPARVGPGMRVTATVRFDEPLEAPALVALIAGDARYPLTREGDGYGRVVDASMASGDYSIEVDATDVNKNRAVMDIGAVEVDTTGPLVLSVAPVAAVVRLGDALAVRVTLDDDAATATGIATLRGSARTLALTPDADGALAALADAAGPWDVVVNGVDDLGNSGPPRGGATVVVDDAAPALTDASVQIVAPPGARRTDVSAATVGSVVRVSFAIDEDAAAPPEVTLGGAATTLALESGEARLFRFATTVDADTPEGELAAVATVTDAVGNTAQLSLGTVRVDRTPPAAPDGLRYRYTRRPWSFDADERFVVDGEDGAARPGARVLVVDAADPSAPALAFADADGVGAARLVLPPLDRPQVRVVEVDEAGNASVATLVLRVTWVAAFGGKVPGDNVTNPHRAVLLDGVPRAPRDRRVEIRAEVGDELALTDGEVVRVEATPTWRVVEPLSAPPYDTRPSVTYDPQRGACVVVSMDSFLGEPLAFPYTFDGQWAVQVLVGQRPTPAGASVVADVARGTTLLLDAGSRSWIVDDASAVQRGAIPTRFSPALAADVTSRRVIAFGGSELAFVPTMWFDDTWSWDGFTWTELDLDVAPSPRVTSMAHDPVRGGLLLFGGGGPDGFLGDTWHFDGASWTELSPASAPPALAPYALVSDPDHARVLLIAAEGVWSWDGDTWLPDAFEPPPPPTPGLFSGIGAAWSGVENAPLLFISNERAVHRGAEPAWEAFGADVMSLPTTFSLAQDPARGGALMSSGGTIANAHRALTENGYRSLPLGAGPTAANPLSTYDAQQEVVVLVSAGQTWQWDGAWTLAGAAPALTALTFDPNDPAGARVVGIGDSGTFAWTGADWTQIGPAPPGVAAPHLAYDPVSDALLALEERVNNTPLGATLARGAASWQPASTEGINGHSFSITLDEDQGRVVLTGGRTPVSCQDFVGCFGGFVLGGTLEWDGNAWQAVDTDRAFTPRSGHESAYVAALGGIVVTPGSATETYVLHRAPRVAQMIEVSLASSGLPLDAITRLTPRVVAAAVGGAELAGYLSYPGRFTPLAADVDDAFVLSADLTDPAVIRGMVAGPAAVFTVASAVGGAALDVDEASLEVDFVLAD